ncbi:hypothetical protein YA0745_21265 [Pseudomonas synxantha]|uniref:Phage protein n=1 Tax=Pseudomonas synxantha TaxID=47883 RepID=A0ABS0UTJ0_9PSED|nr:hypothetical protein [Pseudomonas synxantha]MBI6567587.1 hypothetical protein [Pseudomonas synxantha]MBI6582298.1 hypothetical protein [Pseudomonas synxantha]MBI6645459.1 hypothetical protein [Pseudomonas synxantha]
MISIRSSYHPIDAAILWCDLSDHKDEILQVDLSQPGSLRKHFPQWPKLHDHVECIYDAILSGELPATYLGQPITSDSHVHRVYYSVRRIDLLVWFVRSHPDQKPAFLFAQNVDHSECVSLDAHLAKQAELDYAVHTIEQLQQTYAATTDEMASLSTLNDKLKARLESLGIPSETSEAMHNTLIGAMLATTLGKTPNGKQQSIYSSQAALVQAILLRFPGVDGLSKSTIDRRFADARRLMAQIKRD